MIQKKRRKW